MALSDDVSLGFARDWLRERVNEGAKCPCCTQFAKVCSRKLNSGMARSLIMMYRVGGTDWIDITTAISARSREEGKLRYWGLVEPHPDTRGIWRVTELGEQWVRDMATVPSHVEIYDNRSLRLGGDPIRVRDALGSKFDYDDLLGTPGTESPGI